MEPAFNDITWENKLAASPKPFHVKGSWAQELQDVKWERMEVFTVQKIRERISGKGRLSYHRELLLGSGSN